MKGRAGAVWVSSLSGVALLLAVLQAAVVFAHARPQATEVSAAVAPSGHRYSAPGGRSGNPYSWPADAPARMQPEKPEEQRRAPPRSRGTLPAQGPRPARRLTA